jgi:hypothetical protein
MLFFGVLWFLGLPLGLTLKHRSPGHRAQVNATAIDATECAVVTLQQWVDVVLKQEPHWDARRCGPSSHGPYFLYVYMRLVSPDCEPIVWQRADVVRSLVQCPLLLHVYTRLVSIGCKPLVWQWVDVVLKQEPHWDARRCICCYGYFLNIIGSTLFHIWGFMLVFKSHYRPATLNSNRGSHGGVRTACGRDERTTLRRSRPFEM